MLSCKWSRRHVASSLTNAPLWGTRRLLTLVRPLNCLAESFLSKGSFFFGSLHHRLALVVVRSALRSMNSAMASLSTVVKIDVSQSLLRNLRVENKLLPRSPNFRFADQPEAIRGGSGNGPAISCEWMSF